MGQQQLLLLVLGIVIVGIAILVGINAYSENSVKSNYDALLQDGIRIATDAQSWKTKPAIFGGSPDGAKNDSLDFLTLDFVDLGFAWQKVGDGSAPNSCYNNINGIFNVDATYPGLEITGASKPYQNQITVNVNGALELNISLDPAASVQGGARMSDGATPTALSATTECT